jgi:hypothetical protein
MAVIGLKLQPNGHVDQTSQCRVVYVPTVAVEPWGPGDLPLMLHGLLIGVARLELQIFAVGHWTGVTMQVAGLHSPRRTVLVKLSPAQLGAARALTVQHCPLLADDRSIRPTASSERARTLGEICQAESHSRHLATSSLGQDIINALGSE